MAPQLNSPTIKLANGKEMPLLGLGTWKSPPGVVTQAVKDAIDIGYRHFDGAHAYENEHEVGEGLNAKIKEGVVKREELFVTSKLWNTMHRPEMVEQACRTQLKNLGLDYLDLYLIHWPVSYKDGQELFPKDADGNMILSTTDYIDTWPEMERLVTLGLVKSIGVSNFNSEQIKRILKIAKIKPVVNQVECHPYLAQTRLMEFCKSQGISITAYSPLGSRDRPWAKPGDKVMLEDEKLVAMATRLGKTVAQILLRFQVQRGNVVIPKSVHKARMIENSQIFDFELTKEDMAYLQSFDCNGRLCAELGAIKHEHYPFHIEF